MYRLIFEIVCAVVVTNFITWQIAWRYGVKNGEKWEKYRESVKAPIQTVRKRDQ